MTQTSAAATEAARQLWPSEAADVGAPEEGMAAADRVCAQLRAGLGRWVGSEGYRALLARALELVRPEHPALGKLSCDGTDGERIADAVRAYGAAEVTSGLLALVATVIDFLGRIVGEEMAVELVKQTGAVSPRGASNTGTEGGRDG